ncbi:MAG: Gldg family protein [Planctomycetes bacterium]|nr:Gldg family protein [Planctomycetota bacterium]MBL7040898.1 Gldg family protein [Pirellulaceae bacterium]
MGTYTVRLLLSSMIVASLTASLTARDPSKGRKPTELDQVLARQFEAGDKWAVVVGVGQYFDSKIPDLKNPAADARLVADVLSDVCGYPAEQVLLICDDQAEERLRPSGANLRKHIADWLKQSKQGDTVVVFYSGLGFVDERGHGILAPADCDKARLAETGFLVDDLREMLDQCKATQKLLILDCGHGENKKDKKSIGASSAELGIALQNADRLITLGSCAKNESSGEWGAKQHGLFAYLLAEGLRGKADLDGNGQVDSDELYRFLADKVPSAALWEVGNEQNPVRCIPLSVKGVYALARVPAASGAVEDDPGPREVAVQPTAMSADAKKLVAGLELSRPVSIEAFISPSLPEPYVVVQRNLKATMDELKNLDGQQIQVQIHNTEPFTEQAVRAEERFGIIARQVMSTTRQGTRTDNLFMGVAVTCGLESVILPFLDRGMSVEYELVRSLCTVSGQKRKTVGVLATDAKLFGHFAARKTSAVPDWPIIDKLKKHYSVISVDSSGPITEEYDVLLAVQPSSLGAEQMDNFIKAVAEGQPTLIFEDPFPAFVTSAAATSAPRLPASGPNMMFQQQPPQPKGDIGPLWSLLGVDFSNDRVVWQDYNPYPILASLPRGFVFVDAGSGANRPFNENDVVSAGIQHMLFPFPGFVNRRSDSELGFSELVRTGTMTGEGRYDELMQTMGAGRSGGIDTGRRQIFTRTPYTLAAHIVGSVKRAGVENPSELDVILVADVDMLHETFFRLSEQSDTPEGGAHYDFDNVTFILNALDVLAGDQRFLGIRRRRGKHPVLNRTPEQIAADRREAELRQRIQQEYDEAVELEERAYAEKIEELQSRIKREDKPKSELLMQLKLAHEDGQRRLEVKKQQLARRRDLEISRIGRGPVAAGPRGAVETPDLRGEPLFPDFDSPLAAAGLEIVEHDAAIDKPRAFTVAQVDGRWSIPSHGNYPTDARDQLVAAITDLMDLTVLEVASETRRDHELYGVVDPDPGTLPPGAEGVGLRVTIRDSQANVLLAMIVGREVRDRPDLRYVRRVGQIPVYTVRVNTDKLSTRFSDWIDEDLLKLNPWDIKQVQIRDYSIEMARANAALVQRTDMTLGYDDEDESKWRLLEHKTFEHEKWKSRKLTDDQVLNTSILNDMRHALSDLKIVDVSRKPEGLDAVLADEGAQDADREALSSLLERGFFAAKLRDGMQLFCQEGEVHVLMQDGIRYRLRFGKIDEESRHATAKESDGEEPADELDFQRYLMVTAEFDQDAAPKPDLEPLPRAQSFDDRSRLQAERTRISKENERRLEEYEERVAAIKARAKELNGRFSDWYYLISDRDFRNIRLSQHDVLDEDHDGSKQDGEGFSVEDFDRLKQQGLDSTD